MTYRMPAPLMGFCKFLQAQIDAGVDLDRLMFQAEPRLRETLSNMIRPGGRMPPVIMVEDEPEPEPKQELFWDGDHT